MAWFMDRPYFREFSSPMLDKPIFIQGLPGFGDVGRIAAHLLIKFCGARLFAEMYSPYFPDYVHVGPDGICRLPKYEFYAASMGKNDFIIMTGDAQIFLEDVVAHYELCGEVLNFIKKYNCILVIALGGIPSAEDTRRVYVAATSPRLAAEFAEKGATLYTRGRIIGAAGLILGMAKENGLDGVCILGATTGLETDREAAFSVFKFLVKAFGMS